MKVYLLIREYSTSYESWESIEGIYKNKEDAEQRSDNLNRYLSEENSPGSGLSFYVQPRDVL